MYQLIRTSKNIKQQNLLAPSHAMLVNMWENIKDIKDSDIGHQIGHNFRLTGTSRKQVLNWLNWFLDLLIISCSLPINPQSNAEFGP